MTQHDFVDTLGLILFTTKMQLNTKTCPKCGACWINNQHYWAGTNKLGNETELASLVCDKFGDDTCINPARGTTKGDGWAKRAAFMDAMDSEINLDK